MLRVMLVDDEALARQGLRAGLENLPGVEVCGEAGDLTQALQAIPALAPDALFLDVRMPRGDGFALLKQLADPPPVVFVTAHSEYAVQAFEIPAVDYLLKPVRSTRLGEAVARLRAALQRGEEEPVYGESDRICLRTPERTIVTVADDILLLEADGDFTRVTVDGEQPLLICQTLGHFERTLPGPRLVRLDRSLMINIERVETIEVSPTRGARVSLRGLEHPVELGRAALRRLREAIPQVAGDLEG
ncbi:MAG: LytR/AlgR family response regulator transcription factor [Chthoniobacterales bacterium]|jgi:two-component system LytT family response regulator